MACRGGVSLKAVLAGHPPEVLAERSGGTTRWALVVAPDIPDDLLQKFVAWYFKQGTNLTIVKAQDRPDLPCIEKGEYRITSVHSLESGFAEQKVYTLSPEEAGKFDWILTVNFQGVSFCCHEYSSHEARRVLESGIG